jgi:FAD/FMN-containing dehydrogenase
MHTNTEVKPARPINQKVFEELRPRLRGPLILPGDAGYDENRSVWNGMIDRRPAAIARCLGVADVIACVNFSREHGIPPSIKGGGHNISGLAVSDGGLMLDMSLMRGVWVDPSLRSARAQAGCLLGDLDREAQVHGLAPVLGFVSNTGIAGLTLGGGFGYLTRRFGWTTDTVLSMEIVTAEGKVVHASESDNNDLFWAARGGGGNFGVVTHFQYRLFPVGPEVVAGGIAWPAENAAEILGMYRAVLEESPPELVCAAVLRLAPPAPWINKQYYGKPIIALFVCDSGPVKDAEHRVARIKGFGAPVGDIIQRRSFVSQQGLLDATQPKGRRYYWKSEYLPRLTPEILAEANDQALRIVSPHSAIVLFPVDGAIRKLSDDHSATANRDAVSVLNITASWEKPEDDARNIEWARKSWERLRRFSTGGTYVNFLTEEEGGDRIRAAYGKNYDRLMSVKAKWDPTNLFRTNKNIQPA